MVKEKTYIVVHSWMRSELELKGNELLVYALIYGFSQDGFSEFKGSVSYISDWIGASKPTVLKCLQNLTEEGLVEKTDIQMANNLHLCTYRAILPPVKKFDRGGKETLPGAVKKLNWGGKETLPNNNIYKDKYINIYKNIMSFLNEKAGTHYRYDVKKNQELMKARLDEGFTVDDFYKVIDNMVSAWKNNPKMKNYIRPQTLFGTKFESYLNRIGTGNAYRDSKTEEQRKQDDEVLAILRGDYD